MSLEDAIGQVSASGGLAIPAHVNRPAFGLIANLGFVPVDVQIDALEISRHLKVAEATQKFPQIKGYPLVQGGDAHRLDELLGANVFEIEIPTITELKLALHGAQGRSFQVRSA